MMINVESIVSDNKGENFPLKSVDLALNLDKIYKIKSDDDDSNDITNFLSYFEENSTISTQSASSNEEILDIMGRNKGFAKSAPGSFIKKSGDDISRPKPKLVIPARSSNPFSKNICSVRSFR